jgi:uroporphyrin-III C-methyltransferase
MKKEFKQKLTLVGAGPGDPELISLKGIKALSNANAVLYDALISKELLKHAPAAKLVYVGKRAGKHSYSQEEINRLIIEHVFRYGHVVRLKGGDPFVFGRGYEEIEYAEAFGIETEVIPGISSSTGVAGINKIPLTARGVNESFFVITGTTKKGNISDDIRLAAQSSATVVILMGLGKLREITRIFSQYGKAETPAAIIQNGTLKNQKSVFGTVETIVKEARHSEIKSPAIIIIGETVALYNSPERHDYIYSVKNLSSEKVDLN